MPIYLYKCSENHLSEQIHSIMEEPKVVCSKCKKPMDRVPQVMAVKFIGSGWAAKEK